MKKIPVIILDLILYDDEEPRQETLEEFAKKSVEIYVNEREKQTAYLEIIRGAKWQQQQNKNLYSEEDLKEAFFRGCYSERKIKPIEKCLEEFIEQFKKK